MTDRCETGRDACDCLRCKYGPLDRINMPTQVKDLQGALQALVDVVDRIGGYMTPEDQRVLWRARVMARGGR